MSNNAVNLLFGYLKETGLEPVLHGGCQDREYWLAFSRSGKIYKLYFEFPMLPVLLVYKALDGARLDEECLNAKNLTRTKNLAKEYYAAIEEIPNRQLDAIRCSDAFDRWVIPVVNEFISILAERFRN